MIQFTFQDEAHKLNHQEQLAYMKEHQSVLDEIEKPNLYADSLGWLKPEVWASESMLSRLEEKAREVQQKADALVLIGIGGSNNAARAVIKALQKPEMPKVYYAGNSIAPHSINQVLEELRGKSVYINVIAKNFETLEPGVAFRIFRKFLKAQYGKLAHERIIVTGSEGSQLEELCKKYSYTFLTFPEDIGGRYSAISDVGLFPMAVAGIDIRKVVLGAADMRKELLSKRGIDNSAFYYAATRNCLYQQGYRMEMLSFFEPRYRYFSKWWTQLFAESEGKEGKGIYPIAAECSEDLHSIGQFVQEGTPIIYETFLEIKNQDASCILEADEIEDGFHYLNQMDLWDVNKIAQEATIKAHSIRLPIVRIGVDCMDEYHFGQLFYFFEYACYISGTLLKINPFSQPGVEDYKGYMFRALGK